MTTVLPDTKLKQANLLCEMKFSKRLDFISEGIPIILKSAEGYWDAASRLTGQDREANVLAGFAREEIAKILILMDIVRSPKHTVSSRIGKLVKWYYSHLVRLIYADALSWSVSDVSQLREYVKEELNSYNLEGDYYEYIVPNFNNSLRESRLYADIVANKEGEPEWSNPLNWSNPFIPFEPVELMLVKAMSKIGIFKKQGISATAEIWGKTEFIDNESAWQNRTLKITLINRLIEEKICSTNFSNQDVNLIIENWQIPMYDLELKLNEVSIDRLRKIQENYWENYGDCA